MTSKDMDSILSSEFREPQRQAIGNLKIQEKYDFVGTLVDLLLFGLIRPYTVIISGDVYEKAPKNEIEMKNRFINHLT